jgi:BlaI family transcriptional regulator, penicillinase repressor
MRLTEAEWTIMNALWQNHPATARDIADRLASSSSWAYTTIKTMLDRLVEKGALAEAKRGATSLYTPLITKRHARTTALKALADQAFDGAFGPLMHFLIEDRKLGPKEKKALIEAIRNEGSKKGEAK